MSRKPADAAARARIAPAPFFILRTPLLPLDDFLSLAGELGAVAVVDDPHQLPHALEEDRHRIRRHLAEQLDRGFVREALWLASPSLVRRLPDWKDAPESRRGREIEGALFRYYVRMTSRPAPLGLLAGYSIGRIGRTTGLVLGPREDYERRSRLDYPCLWDLHDRLMRDPRVRETVICRPNAGLYRSGDRLRYPEAIGGRNSGLHDLVSVDRTSYLESILERARDGATLSSLAGSMIEDEPEFSPGDVRDFVDGLIHHQILVPDLEPALTGSGASRHLAELCRSRPPSRSLAERLDRIEDVLERIDDQGIGVDPREYDALGSLLDAAIDADPGAGPGDVSRALQVDLAKPGERVVLGRSVIRDLRQGVDVLHRMGPYGGASSIDLDRFRETFEDRYGSTEVPLLEALDGDLGIGFPPGGGRTTSPLLDAAGIHRRPSSPSFPWGTNEELLVEMAGTAVLGRNPEVVLDESHIKRFRSNEPAPLPDTFQVWAHLAASSEEALARGDYRILVKSVDGPPAGRAAGRFCLGDPRLLELVRRELTREERLRPDAVFAEVVYNPGHRAGNVVARPILREYELVYLGRSGAPPERQIPVSDLMVSVHQGRIVLRSTRLGREVLPRITNSHHFGLPMHTPVYRFLGKLQGQGVNARLGWNWGPIKYTFPFLPRVRYGRVVLCRASWWLSPETLESLAGLEGASLFRSVHRLRQDRGLPRLLMLTNPTNELLLDLENISSVEALARIGSTRQDGIHLRELFPPVDELCVRGPEGHFAHELVIPFSSLREPERPAPAPAPAPSSRPRSRFAPGSEWLSFSIYGGCRTLDDLLARRFAGLVHSFLAEGLADRFFFIRYHDPQVHLRLRFHGCPADLNARVLPAMERALTPLLEEERIDRVRLDTYDPEVDRYGGPLAMPTIERFFHEDSLSALAMVRAAAPDSKRRWLLALAGADGIFRDLGLDPAERCDLMRSRLVSLEREFVIDASTRDRMARVLSDNRDELVALLADPGDDPMDPETGRDILARRSESLRPIVADLRRLESRGAMNRPLAAIATSLIHLHINRVIPQGPRAHELAFCSYLDRIYRQAMARRGP